MWFKQQKFIFPQFKKMEIQDQSIGKLISPVSSLRP